MEFSELIKKRESCRAYSDKKVPREKLMALIEAAGLSPSGCNSQPWRFIVVDEENKVKELGQLLFDSETGINRHAAEASALIVILETRAKLKKCIEQRDGSQIYAQMDIGSATAYLTLKAASEGLSTCIMGWYEQGKIKEFLGIPEDLIVRLVVTVGYAETPEIRKKVRKNTEEIVSFNQY